MMLTVKSRGFPQMEGREVSPDTEEEEEEAEAQQPPAADQEGGPPGACLVMDDGLGFGRVT